MISKQTYFGIEILRFLQRTNASNKWKKTDIPYVVTLDADIKKQFQGIFKRNPKDEKDDLIHAQIEHLIKDKIPVPDKNHIFSALNVLKKNGYVMVSPGKGGGCWITERGMSSTFYDVINLFGDGIGMADCEKFFNSYNCPSLKVCKAKSFYRELNQFFVFVFKSVSLVQVSNGDVDFTELANHYFNRHKKG